MFHLIIAYLLNEINNKSILVIRVAGTIGSSYIKQILKYKPSKITVVDINENGLTELTSDLRNSNLLDYNPEYITYPVNLLSDTFDKIFNSCSWQVLANFSAHKHVRSEKDKISVEALIKNNVFRIYPNKWVEYMYFTKAAIFSYIRCRSMINEAGCGESVEAENIEALSNKIIEYSRMSKKELNLVEEKRKRCSDENLTHEILAKIIFKYYFRG